MTGHDNVPAIHATEESPTVADMKTIQIAGVNFEAPFKYAEGHVLTAVEAKALNQTRFENLRNNFATTVKASNEGKEGSVSADNLATTFAEYEAAYDFATPGAGGSTSRTLDPIEKEAFGLARDMVKAALAAKGRTYSPPKDASEAEKNTYKAQIAAKVEEVAAREEVVAAAKKNVAARAKSLAAISEGLDL